MKNGVAVDFFGNLPAMHVFFIFNIIAE